VLYGIKKGIKKMQSNPIIKKNKEIKSTAAELERKVKEIQKINKEKIIPLLDDIVFVQKTLNISLGLWINEDDYYAPRRYFFKDSEGNRVNFHPSFGVKRYKGNRCEDEYHTLIDILLETETFLSKIIKKFNELIIPSIEWEKMPILKKIIDI